MSQFTVDLEEEAPTRVVTRRPQQPAELPEPKRTGSFLMRAAVVLLVLLVIGVVGAFAYWQRVKSSPQYSLALLVDAARRDDQAKVDELVDTDSVVDSFLPQIIDKAVELYGKGLPDSARTVLNAAADQVKPAIKRRAREEVPRVIREKTDKFERVPYWAIAIGAGWFLDIKTEGDTAKVVSKIENRPFELTMKRNGGLWKVTEIKDDVVARRIAEKIGEEIVAIASKDGINKAAENLGVKSLDDLRKKVEGLIFK